MKTYIQLKLCQLLIRITRDVSGLTELAKIHSVLYCIHYKK